MQVINVIEQNGRRIFTIDAGEMSAEEVKIYLENIRKEFQERNIDASKSIEG